MNAIRRFREKYIGDRHFYGYVLAIAIPMILQNLITNSVSLLDNIMVGRVGTEQMSGVSIVNQFVFIFNLTMFGGVSGPSIFGAQFYGKKDYEGQKFTFRIRIILALLVTAIGMTVFFTLDSTLIGLYLSKDDAPEVIAATLSYGREYMRIIAFSLFPFAIGQAYSSVVRESGETRIPMIGSLTAVGVNLILDYGLIFGRLGLPQMGVAGAALATVIAKCIEALVVIVWVHTHRQRAPYAVGLYKGFHIPGKLARRVVVKGCPLLVNEFLWSLSVSLVAQCYSTRGLEVVAARNISSTLVNLFGVFYVQLGGAIGIIIGAKLGAGKLKEAKDWDNKLLVFSVFMTVIVAVCMLPVAEAFPYLYNTEPEVRALATFFVVVQAIAMPIWSFTNASYFTLRSGGKTGITFLFDFGFSWGLMIPLAFILAYATDMEIHLMFILVTFSEAVKAVIGYFMVKSNVWIQNLVEEPSTDGTPEPGSVKTD